MCFYILKKRINFCKNFENFYKFYKDEILCNVEFRVVVYCDTNVISKYDYISIHKDINDDYYYIFDLFVSIINCSESCEKFYESDFICICFVYD